MPNFTNKDYDRADDLFLQPPAILSTKSDRDTTMYSFDKPAYSFWRGFQIKLYRAGYTQAQVREILCSKFMRWMFDSRDDDMEQVGYEWATKWLKLNKDGADRMLREECNL